LKAEYRQLSAEARRLRSLLTAALDQVANYFVELEGLREELGHISSLPLELNAWYTRLKKKKIILF